MRGMGCQDQVWQPRDLFMSMLTQCNVQKMLTKLGLDIRLQTGLCLRGARAQSCITIWLKT